MSFSQFLGIHSCKMQGFQQHFSKKRLPNSIENSQSQGRFLPQVDPLRTVGFTEAKMFSPKGSEGTIAWNLKKWGEAKIAAAGGCFTQNLGFCQDD